MEIRQINSCLQILRGPTDLPKEYKVMVAEYVLAQLKANPPSDALIEKADKLKDAAKQIKNEALRCQRAVWV